MPLYSSPSAEDDATLTGSDWRLAVVGTAGMVVSVAEWAPDTVQKRGVFYPKDRDRALVVRGATYGKVGTLKINVLSEDDYDAVMDMLTGDDDLLLRSPLGRSWFISTTGDVSEAMLRAAPTEDDGDYPLRFAFTLSVPFVEIEPEAA